MVAESAQAPAATITQMQCVEWDILLSSEDPSTAGILPHAVATLSEQLTTEMGYYLEYLMI